MTFLHGANNYVTELDSAITSGSTTMIVKSAEGSPDVPFLLTIDSEIVKVTAKDGTAFAIERGQEGTTPVAHLGDTEVKNNFTAGMWGMVGAHTADYVLEEDATIYIDEQNGSNSNSGNSSENAVATWDKVREMLSYRINGADLTIRVIGSLTDPITLDGHFVNIFKGNGRRLQIIGDTQDKTNHEAPYFHIGGIYGDFQHAIEIMHLTFTGDRNHIWGCNGFNIEDCDIHNDDTFGIDIRGSHGRVRNCNFQNHGRAIVASYYSQVHCEDNTGEVTTRYVATNRASVIAIEGTEPTVLSGDKHMGALGIIVPNQIIERFGEFDEEDKKGYWVKLGNGTMILNMAVSHDATTTDTNIISFPEGVEFLSHSSHPVTVSISGNPTKGDFSNSLSEVEAVCKINGRARTNDVNLRSFDTVSGIDNLGLALSICGRWKEL